MTRTLSALGVALCAGLLAGCGSSDAASDADQKKSGYDAPINPKKAPGGGAGAPGAPRGTKPGGPGSDL